MDLRQAISLLLLACLTGLAAPVDQAPQPQPLRPARTTPTQSRQPDPSVQRRQTTGHQIRARRNARLVEDLVVRDGGCSARRYYARDADASGRPIVDVGVDLGDDGVDVDLGLGGIGVGIGLGGGSRRKRKRGYPSCTAGKATRGGYARYPGWDLEGIDLPGMPVYPDTVQQDLCLKSCEQSEVGTCAGVVWTPSACRLTSTNICDGVFSPSSSGPQELNNPVVSLRGDCAAWSPYIPEGMDAVCCNC